jgi:hypothetical protein
MGNLSKVGGVLVRILLVFDIRINVTMSYVERPAMFMHTEPLHRLPDEAFPRISYSRN